MLRFFYLVSAVLMLSLTVSFAETYRCKMADCRLIYTDQPGNAFVDCQIMEGEMNKGSFNVLPVKDAPVLKTNEAPETVRANVEDPAYASWVERAQTLVKDYDDAVRARYRETFAADQRLAIQMINKITGEKQDLLNELSKTSLSSSKKKSVQTILDQIPSEQ
ncbi:MAG: hypothetical protein JRF07_04000 [Deltaproteobacteria bacterium]|nr:hypothetical protein [Deltaproteobacteria bacterium]